MSDTQNMPPAPVTRQVTQEIGKTGTQMYRGQIVGEEYNAELRGPALIRKVEVMRRSNSTVRAALLVVKLPILGADWKLDPASDGDGNISPLDQEIADHCTQELFSRNVNFFDFMREGLTCQEFGYSVFEKMFEPTKFNGKFRWGIKKLGFRKQNTIFRWEQSNSQPGIVQMTKDGNTFDIPRDKIIIFTNDKEGDNYEGVSLLRYAYMDWDMLDKMKITQAIKLDRFSTGVPKISAKDGQTPGADDLKKAEEIVSNMRTNEEGYILVPSTMDLEMLDMKAGSTEDIIPFLHYLDRRISQSVIAGFMELGGHSGSGSQSLSKDLTALFFKSEEATARTMQSTIQEELIKQLVDLNWTTDELVNGYPQLTFSNIADDNLAEMATSIGTLAEKQLITPDLDLEDYLRKSYRLPAMSSESRKAYEEAQNMKREGAQIAHDNLKNGVAPIDQNGNQPTTTPVQKKPDPEKVKASLDAARETARKANHALIDAITG